MNQQVHKGEITVTSRSDPGCSPTCRFCEQALTFTFVDLGMSPPCESFLSRDQLGEMEPFYPLHVYVCGDCFLVQLEPVVAPHEVFREYAYFSSYSDSWLDHAEKFVDMIVDRRGLGPAAQVIEIASNDGYLLQYFAKHGVPALGIEPAGNVAEAAIARGVDTRVAFFDDALAEKLAKEDKLADLVIANNVLAQVPGLNGFIRGLKRILKPSGVITVEFPHLLKLMEERQFDTIYHEHYSYFSFTTTERIFAAHGLVLFDVEELTTHGGSLRIYARHAENAEMAVTDRAVELREREMGAGLTRLDTYASFGLQVEALKRDVQDFLNARKREGASIVGYGAPGKGNTLLNYCGIRADIIDFTVDRNPYKHGKFLPGTHIPVFPPERIRETRPDYVLILPWNLKAEIMDQLAYIREWGGRFVFLIPEVQVHD